MKITKGTHVDIAPGTLVKDYEPTYKWIEVVEESYIPPYIKKIGLLKVETFKVRYGDRVIESVRNYHSTKTTSIIIKKEKLWLLKI